MWDPTSVGEENETPFIRVWNPLPRIRVLKTLRGTLKGKTQRGQCLLAVDFGRYNMMRVKWHANFCVTWNHVIHYKFSKFRSVWVRNSCNRTNPLLFTFNLKLLGFSIFFRYCLLCWCCTLRNRTNISFWSLSHVAQWWPLLSLLNCNGYIMVAVKMHNCRYISYIVCSIICSIFKLLFSFRTINPY